MMMTLTAGINLRTGDKGIFPLAHVVDVDYNDFDPAGVEVRVGNNICSFYPHLSSIPGEEREIPAGLSGKCPMRSKGSGNHCSGDLFRYIRCFFYFINEFIQNLRAEQK